MGNKKIVVKHIFKEGARYHVSWWDSNGAHCSEPTCEKNYPDLQVGDTIKEIEEEE